VGTYFGPDGAARRVNAAIAGNRMDFYFDWTNPDQPTGSLLGVHFTGYLFSNGRTAMAGTLFDNRDSNTYAFTALKGTTVSGVPHAPAALDCSAYGGTWQLNTDGTPGTLDIAAVDSSNRVLAGNYVTPSGATYGVSGAVSADPRAFTFTIAGPNPTTYSGYLNGHELGVMSGTTTSGSTPFGFYAYRIGDYPAVDPVDPPDPPEDAEPIVCRAKPYLPQCQ
jgi:hypothetical protein